MLRTVVIDIEGATSPTAALLGCFGSDQKPTPLTALRAYLEVGSLAGLHPTGDQPARV